MRRPSYAAWAFAIAFVPSWLVAAATTPTNNANGRRHLVPKDSIGQTMKEENSQGNKNPRFTIVAEISNGNPFTEDVLTLDVIQATPAVTAETMIIEQEGSKGRPINMDDILWESPEVAHTFTGIASEVLLFGFWVFENCDYRVDFSLLDNTK